MSPESTPSRSAAASISLLIVRALETVSKHHAAGGPMGPTISAALDCRECVSLIDSVRELGEVILGTDPLAEVNKVLDQMARAGGRIH